MKERAVTFAEFARIIGCRKSFVTQLRHDDRLVLDESRRVLVEASKARILATRDPSRTAPAAAGAPPTAPDTPVPPEPADAPAGAAEAADAPSEPEHPESFGYQYWRERSERAKALAAERENAVAAAQLLPLADVQRAVADAATTFRTRVEAMADTLAPQLAAAREEGEVRALLRGEIEHALTEASRALAAVARTAPAEGAA